MLKINNFVRAKPLFFHTNRVKCFSVFRVFLNIVFSVYMQYNTIQYSFISAQHICSVHVMSNMVVDIYINAGLGDSY